MNPAVTIKSKADLINFLILNESDIIKYGVRQLGLFGSFVRDEANDKSDIDLYVDFIPEKKTFRNFMDLIFYIQDATGREVTVVTPQSLSPYLGPHILKTVENVIG
jgi:uncharacterized protein